MQSSRDQSHSYTFVLALGASVLLHMLLAGVAFRVPARFVDASLVEQMDNADPDHVKLGESVASPIKVTWLGSVEPIEHEAPLSHVDQADQRLGSAGAPAPVQEDSLDQVFDQTFDEIEPTVLFTPIETVSTEQTQPTEVQEQPTESQVELVRADLSHTLEAVSSIADQFAAQFTMRAERAIHQQHQQEVAKQAQSRAVAAAKAQALANAERKALRQSQQSQKPSEQASASSDTGGGNSDRESDAASTKKTFTVKPGQPLSAQGIRLATHKPKFTDTAVVTARPRNPVIEITFGSKGTVVRKGVRVVGKGTGYPEVDRPLIAAMYLWTASGDKIDELGPKGTLSMRILILLN